MVRRWMQVGRVRARRTGDEFALMRWLSGLHSSKRAILPARMTASLAARGSRKAIAVECRYRGCGQRPYTLKHLYVTPNLINSNAGRSEEFLIKYSAADKT